MADRRGENFTVHQVCTVLQVEEEVLRHWEREFADFLELKPTKGKRNLFNQRQLEILAQIKELLLTEQYTVPGAKRRLALDRTLSSALGVDQNLKTTIFFMFSAIMQELQGAREESRDLARQVELLRREKSEMQERLWEEQNKGLMDFLRDKIQNRKSGEIMGVGESRR